MKEFIIIIIAAVILITLISFIIKYYENNRENTIKNKTIDLLNKYGKTFYENKKYYFL